MATLQHNVTTTITQNLLAAGDNVNDVKYISIANVGQVTAFVDLLLNQGDNNYYLLKNAKVLVGEALNLNKDNNISFNNTTNGFSLRVQVDDGEETAVPVDIVITR